MNWYSKLYSCVHWNGVFSDFFKVSCGVRPGGILSPILFNLYVDDLIELLRECGYGCYVSKTFIGCIMYADDLILVSSTISGLQEMINICSNFSVRHDIVLILRRLSPCSPEISLHILGSVDSVSQATGCAVAQHCCENKGDQPFQWEIRKFEPPYISTPLTFHHQT